MNLIIQAEVFMIVLLLSAPVLAQALTDPTRPPAFQGTPVVQESSGENTNWKLTAIRISENDRTALINGVIVREGDVTGPARVREIQPVQVLLEYNNSTVALRLYGDRTIKKTANSTTTENQAQ